MLVHTNIFVKVGIAVKITKATPFVCIGIWLLCKPVCALSHQNRTAIKGLGPSFVARPFVV